MSDTLNDLQMPNSFDSSRDQGRSTPLPLSDVSAASVSAASVSAAIQSITSTTSTQAVTTRLRRALHIINGEDYAGAERVQDLLAATLPKYGYEVGFACVKMNKFAHLRRTREARLFNVTTRSPLGLRASWNLRKIVSEHGYGLIHAHTPRSAIVGYWLSRWTGLPFVYHVHSPASRDSTRRCQNWINARAEGIFLSSANRLITVSQSLCDHMVEQGYDLRKITVVPNGVPIVEQVAERPIPTGPWTLGMVALFRPRKGTEVLLEALRLLKNRGLETRLTAVGSFQSAEYEAEIKELVIRLGLENQVKWTGFCTDVNEQLRHMDALVLPSLFGEGLPMVVLEAMAAGIPVVATRVEGVPEALRDGQDGLIAKPDDPLSLADTLQRLIRGIVPAEDLRRSALDRQRFMFSDHSMARAVADVYDQLWRGNHSG